MEYLSHSEQDTIAVAKDFATDLKNGNMIALYGDLGVGKSVFCRALIRALTHTPDLHVPSPTFSLLQTYETPDFDIWHFDLYRVENSEEIYEIGWEEALADGVSLIEWPERIEPLLPPETIKITFEETGDHSRKITIIPRQHPDSGM